MEDIVSLPISVVEGLTAADDIIHENEVQILKGKTFTATVLKELKKNNLVTVKVVNGPKVKEVLEKITQKKPNKGTTGKKNDESSLHRVFPPKTVLFVEGDETKDMYILVSGKVAIYKASKKIAEISEAGSFIGEMSALLGEKRTATVETTEESRFCVVDGTQLIETAKLNPSILIKLCKSLAEKLSKTTKELLDSQK